MFFNESWTMGFTIILYYCILGRAICMIVEVMMNIFFISYKKCSISSHQYFFKLWVIYKNLQQLVINDKKLKN